jgi:hypothetical protein
MVAISAADCAFVATMYLISLRREFLEAGTENAYPIPFHDHIDGILKTHGFAANLSKSAYSDHVTG